ncbi:MAG: hypothetical protein MUE40_03115 [Anaerolineae bacterium]|jgi:4-amino-4-deoxy-L-arabinose transferase-like glycosyltransferase|nr:hypothetical protein [Anaerolineae bacterium]
MARVSLLIIVSVAVVLRVLLALRGGQYYLVDEVRSYRATTFTLSLYHQDWPAAAALLFEGAHPGYTVLAAPGAVVRLLLPDGTAGERLAAALLGLYSAGIIVAIYGIARKTGQDETGALLAALLAAAAGSLFYYARHFVPYDSALLLALLALWLCLEARPALWRLIGGGVLVTASFLTYSGGWMLLAVVGLLLLLYGLRGSWPARAGEIIRRGLGLGIGLGVVAVLVLALARVGGIALEAYVNRAAAFSETINHGSYAEGWSLVWEYLWHSEGLLLLVWLAGAGLALWHMVRTRRWNAALYWLASLVLLYGLMAVTSSVLLRFVMYGRLARQLTPLFILAAAQGLRPLWPRGGWLRPALVGGVLLLAALNLYVPLAQVFPRDVLAQQAARYPAYAPYTTLISEYRLDDIAARPPNFEAAPYLLVNMLNSWYPIVGTQPLPAGEVLYRAPHPVQYRPYQYEGYPYDQRALIQGSVTGMLVLRPGP